MSNRMNSHHPEDVEGCSDLSLERLGTEYIDCIFCLRNESVRWVLTLSL